MGCQSLDIASTPLPMTLETILDACPTNTSAGQWAHFTYSLFQWLIWSPLTKLIVGGMVLATLLVTTGLLIRWFRLSLNRKRPIKRLWILGFPLALVVSISPLVIGEPLFTAFLPDYQGQTADAVVVLGRGDQMRLSRVNIAANLIATQRAPRIFVSGKEDAPIMAAKLADLGVAPDKIAGENCSFTTEENAQYTAQHLLPAGVKSIILVTDAAHLLRSRLVFSSLGFTVIPYASPLPSQTSRRYRRLLAFRESVGLVTYGLLGRYWPRTIASVDTTTAQ